MSRMTKLLLNGTSKTVAFLRCLPCVAGLLLVSSAIGISAEDVATVVPPPSARIDYPADFEPQGDDFVSGIKGNYLGLTQLRGRQLKEHKGTHPLYINLAPPAGRYKGDPIQLGDIIFTVDGKPLGDEAAADFKKAVEKAMNGDGKLTFERWRKGVAETFTLPIGLEAVLPLTQGGAHDPSQEDWNLGTAGAEGWIWSIPHSTTEGSKEIYITQVEPGSPADGVLSVGDVILGANSAMFTNDARKEFAHALTASETPEKAGKLALRVWKDGKTRDVTLTIKVMGSYSESALASPKTEKIIDDACQYLKDKGIGDNISGYVNALGLLATGREDVMPLVRQFAHEVAASGKNLRYNLAMETWYWGYANLFLAEYYMATKDATVLPALREYSTKIAMGQSRVGTWGHSMCVPYPFEDGPVTGIAPGYGAMNQAGLICMISLAVATKGGVENDEITLALQRGREFFRFFLEKGAIPYGDHGAGVNAHEDNGKSSEAAVMFDLLGDEEAATFFTKMTLASYHEREGGHTGNYYSMIWGPLGAARGGDAAVAAFMKRMEWFFDLERRRQGNFIYQGKPGMVNKRNKEHQYKDWDCTGARLLAYSLPLKKLYITGKGRTIKDITGTQLSDAIGAGEPVEWKYKTLSTDDLLARLQSWSPAVRQRAAAALEGKAENVVPQLIALLDSDNRYARYGACQGLRFAGRASEPAADAIIAKALRPEDPLLRYFAMYAFTSYNEEMGLSKVAMRAAPALLEMATHKDPGDPRSRTQQELANVLFYSGNANSALKAVFRKGEGLEKMDSDLVVAAVGALLKVSNGGSRSCVSIVYDKLTDVQRALLWKDIYQATREQAPSGVMFSGGVREAGIVLMSKLHATEGLETAVWYLTNQKIHGAIGSTESMLKLIVETYGGHAKAFIPVLNAAAERYENGSDTLVYLKPNPELAGMIRAAIKAIEEAPTPAWQMTSIAEYLKPQVASDSVPLTKVGDAPDVVVQPAIQHVFFAQHHVQTPDDPRFKLVGNLETLLKVQVNGVKGSASPDLRATLALGERTLDLPLQGPATLPAPAADDPRLVEHGYEDSFTATIPREWVATGLKVAVELRRREDGTAGTVLDRAEFDKLLIGAPTQMVLTMFDVHFFGGGKGCDYEEGWFEGLAARLPVQQLELRRVRDIHFNGIVHMPRAGKPAVRCSSPEEYTEKTGLPFDGEQALSWAFIHALRDAAGAGGVRRPYFLAIYGLDCGGYGGGFTAVGHGQSCGKILHELGHAIGGLPDLTANNARNYPYVGPMPDYPAPGDPTNRPHVGPTWGFDPFKREFIPSVFDGAHRRDPMGGGGANRIGAPGGLYNFFSDHHFSRLQNRLEATQVRWDEHDGVYKSWDQATGSYSLVVGKPGENGCPVEDNVEVISLLGSASLVTPEANFLYPPIGPYPGSRAEVFEATSPEALARAAKAGYTDANCHMCLRVTQGGKVKTYLIKDGLNPKKTADDQSSFAVYAINLPGRDGQVSAVELLATPSVISKGLGADCQVLHNWTGVSETKTVTMVYPSAKDSSRKL